MLAPKRQGFALSRMPLFRECWGADQRVSDIGADQIEAYSAARRAGTLVPPGIAKQERKTTSVRDGTLDSDFRWLSPASSTGPCAGRSMGGGCPPKTR